MQPRSKEESDRRELGHWGTREREARERLIVQKSLPCFLFATWATCPIQCLVPCALCLASGQELSPHLSRQRWTWPRCVGRVCWTSQTEYVLLISMIPPSLFPSSPANRAGQALSRVGRRCLSRSSMRPARLLPAAGRPRKTQLWYWRVVVALSKQPETHGQDGPKKPSIPSRWRFHCFLPCITSPTM